MNPSLHRIVVRSIFRFNLYALVIGIMFSWVGNPAVVLAAKPIDFEKQIRPLLKTHCVECHGEKSTKSGLRLDARKFALEGGDSGPVISPRKSDESELIRRITSDDELEVMPPEGKKLTAGEIALLRTWIDQGALWPETKEDIAALKDKRFDHWAWQAVKEPTIPPKLDDAWGRNPIDQFVRHRMIESGLAPSPEADRRTLIRRLKFDLLGLPPTFEEIEAFVADPDPDAYDKLVDRYLDSAAFGERWARHWLDIAHYADTHGFERDKLREMAWPYRDYVIRAFNADKPYDEFLREQIAGDVIRPDNADAVAATGFLAAGPWDFVGQVETKSPTLRRAARADALDDLSTQVMSAACGVTVNCARCHDHKIDPISQREYYSLWSVFAGVKQSNRLISQSEAEQYQRKRGALAARIDATRAELAKHLGNMIDLADIVGGGDGHGSGKLGHGIDALSGSPLNEKRAFRKEAKVNHFSPSKVNFVDGVVVPQASEQGTRISSTGIVVKEIPETSGQVWDAIRNGPVNSQFTRKLGGVDFSAKDRSLLSLHANAAITFDLNELRTAGAPENMKFVSKVGYFGKTMKNGARFAVYVDGVLKTKHPPIGAKDSLISLEVALPATSRFLTLMATDGGNGISHDQICFGDAQLVDAVPRAKSDATRAVIDRLRSQIGQFEQEQQSLQEPKQIYAVVSQNPDPVHLLRRGNPEDPLELVAPGTLGFLGLPASLGTNDTPEGARRVELAKWITNPANPLTRRVIVNRLWQHHFGVGIVDTPSDFGLAGGAPSHPMALDWLSNRLLAEGWKLKPLHRLICTSATYRQMSQSTDAAAKRDADNRLLSHMNPRHLDAESIRDAILATSGKLNRKMYGPGFRDFQYQEAYAPVYEYITPDRSELWRRSIYRFVVRTTPHPYLTTLDCPDPANLSPVRNVTTTALQSLTLSNNEFMLQQADHLAARVRKETNNTTADQVEIAFRLVLARRPDAEERAAGVKLVDEHGLSQLCRMMLNTNEFIYVD